MSAIETERLETSLKGKVILITGGSSGIGKCTAKILASYGCKVAISGRSPTKLANVEQEMLQLTTAENIMATKVDIANDSEVEEWVNAVVKRFGDLDGAVNCASIEAPRMVPIWEMDNDTWNKVIGTNLGGIMNSLRAELKHMKDGSSIVNVSSILSTVGLENNATYSAAKHGVLGLTRSVAKECGPRKIRVNALAPGFCQTEMMDNAEKILGTKMPTPANTIQNRISDPHEMAKPIVFLLSSFSSYITGMSYAVDGGWQV